MNKQFTSAAGTSPLLEGVKYDARLQRIHFSVDGKRHWAKARQVGQGLYTSWNFAGFVFNEPTDGLEQYSEGAR